MICHPIFPPRQCYNHSGIASESLGIFHSGQPLPWRSVPQPLLQNLVRDITRPLLQEEEEEDKNNCCNVILAFRIFTEGGFFSEDCPSPSYLSCDQVTAKRRYSGILA